jgi:hypothetical protein
MLSIQKEREMKSRNALWPLIVALLSMAQAASPAAAQTADPGRDQNLIAHWRNTRIVFDSAPR